MSSTTFQKEHYDLLVLGSGEAGKYIAWNMASAGKKAAVIERRYIGGSCPNIACLPSKNIIYSAKVAHLAKHAADLLVVISTGSRATIPSTPGLRESKPLTHIEALELDHVPEHLLVLGGGYIGLEFAQAFRRFGSRVTIIGRSGRLLHDEDDDIADAITAVLVREGIELVNNADVREVQGTSGQIVTVQLNRDGQPTRL